MNEAQHKKNTEASITGFGKHDVCLVLLESQLLKVWSIHFKKGKSLNNPLNYGPWNT
jgi:hypothetical protein